MYDSFLVMFGFMGIFFEFALLIGSLISIFAFIGTLYDILRSLPEENLQFPTWFVWLMLIPYAGFIFSWLMQPFGIPNALKKSFPNNPEAISQANTLFGLGFAMQILMTLVFLQACFKVHGIPALSYTVSASSLVLWILYWVKCIKFRNHFLKKENEIYAND